MSVAAVLLLLGTQGLTNFSRAENPEQGVSVSRKETAC